MNLSPRRQNALLILYGLAILIAGAWATYRWLG